MSNSMEKDNKTVGQWEHGPARDASRDAEESNSTIGETVQDQNEKNTRRVSEHADALNLIENPLQRVSKAQNVRDAEQFCRDHNLEDHIPLFQHAALVARDSSAFETVDELDPEELHALQYERDHKWAGTGQLWYAITICALGAATQGWDQTGSNGANLTAWQEFGLGAAYDQAGGQRAEWIVGIVNSIPYISAGLIGCWISDPLNHYFGRRGEIAITAAILIATPIGSGFCRSWQALLVVRLIMGIGIGAKNATVPVFSAEMAPARIRGALVMGWQLWVTFGIFLGFAANCVVKDTGAIAWRLQLGSAFIPAVPLLLGIYFCPESPKWLMKHNNYPKALRSYLKLRRHPIIAARDMYYSHVLYQEEIKMAKGATYFTRLWDCFRIPRIRRANQGASTVMLAQQMCGINIISFYSSTVFVEGGSTPEQALYASLGFGALNFVFAIPAVFLIDTFGRRSLLLATFPFMVVFLLAAGLAFLMDEAREKVRLALIALFIYLFTIAYSCGEGPVAFMYSAEVFPTVQREQGMAWAVAVNNFFAGILGLTFPPMRRAMTPVGASVVWSMRHMLIAVGFYAGLNLIAFFMIFCFVPETKQLTLEELDQVFSIPTKQFINYETKVWLPWVTKRYLFMQKNTPTPPSLLKKADSAY